ncbi:MAG: hypothetical protein WAN33_16180 [Candidatus Acidiferrales bacterium]
MILLFMCGCQRSQPSLLVNQTVSTDQFRWLDRTRDSQVWNHVLVALHQELEPDDPQKVPPHYVAIQYKYIYKIGLYGTAALVIIGYRETKDSPGDAFFNGYSYDLRDGSKRAIAVEPPKPPNVYPQSDGLWLFEVIKLARFDGSPAPDVVFTYSSCTECEAEHLLASFEYEPGKGWAARQWDKTYSLDLEDDPEPDDNIVSADYLFKIKDWNGDGFDDVAVRRREVTQVSKRRQSIEDSTMIYKAENGTLVGHSVTDSKEREGINAELCSDSKLSFCEQRK